MNIFETPMGNLLAWIFLGLIVGILFDLLFRTDTRGGIITTGFFGLIGAILAGIFTNQFFGAPLFGLDLVNLISAIVGSLILAALAKLLFKDNRHIKTDTTTNQP